MPELPEIVCRSREMDAELRGRKIRGIEILQPKCLNVPEDAFVKGLTGSTIGPVSSRGKWIFVSTSQGHLLLNLGMGGEILLVPSRRLPKKWRLRFDLEDGQSLAVNFWWFGYAHYARPGKLDEHEMTSKLGPGVLDLDLPEFAESLRGRRGRIKSFLLNQKNVAGIGNAYIHDILFRAELHPLRTIPTLSEHDIRRLHKAIHVELQRAIDKRGAFYEVDLRGLAGGFTADDLLVGYREGKPCPMCGTPVEKLKTGSTTGFVCPACQPFVA